MPLGAGYLLSHNTCLDKLGGKVTKLILNITLSWMKTIASSLVFKHCRLKDIKWQL